MTIGDGTTRVVVGEITLEVPTSVIPASAAMIDSPAGEFKGPGLRVIVDQGPFADRLDAHVGRSGYREETRDIAGTPARVVSFRGPEERQYVVAAHLPAPKHVTVVVHADDSIPECVPRAIVESVRPVGRSAGERGSNDQATS